jgi:hypothetical protein
MRTLISFAVLVLLLAVAGCSSVPKTPVAATLEAKAGDEIYLCLCATCDCHIVALKPGKCACGEDLAKVTVTEVKGHVATFVADGKTQTVSLKGNYACGCGAGCCQMISDKPGKCGCGRDLVKATE